MFFAVPAEPQFGQRARIGGILEHDRQPIADSMREAQVDVTPPEVRREHQAAGCADASREADAHALADDLRVCAPHGRDGSRQLAHECLRV